ncbi:MAG TPA: hypothetical protein VGD01_07200 [Candidatus Elarobacter sp.]
MLDELATVATYAAALALTALLAAVFVASVHLPPGAAPDGVVGWTTLHHYSKRQELVSYAVVLLLGVALSWGAAVLDARLRARDGSVRGSLARIGIAAPPIVAAVALGFQTVPPPVYADAAFGILISAGVWVATMRSAGPQTAPLAAGPEPAAADPAAEPRFRTAASLAAVVLQALLAGWLLPLLFPAGAAGAELLRWIVPLAAVIAVGRLAPVAGGWSAVSGRAALAGLPALALVTLIRLPGPPGWLVALAVAAAVGLLWRSPRTAAAAARPRTAYAVFALSLVALAGVAAWARNPLFLQGVVVGPLDGDAVTAWLYEGTRGHLVFRDFWYPYGVLHYATAYAGVALGGLDRYEVVQLLLHWTISAACACAVAAALFGRRTFTVVAALGLFFIALAEPRVWVGFTGFVLVVRALRGGSRGLALGGGALLALQLMWSVEVFASAVVALAATLAYLVRRDGPARLRQPAVPAAVGGFAGVALIGAAGAAATGALGPWISGTVRFLGVLDACCGLAYPSILGGPNAAGGPPPHALAVPYADFFLVPGIYLIALAVLVARLRATRRLADGDVTLASTLLFGLVLYRAALTRGDVGHLSFVSVPAVAVALLLVGRAVGNWRTRPVAAAAAVLLFALWPTPRTHALAFYADNDRYMTTLPLALRAARRDAPPGYAEFDSPRGARLFFPAADAAETRDVLAWLRSHLGPNDTVYGVPYAARYEVLLDRTTPTSLGPQMWSAIVTATDQRRLVEELRRARYVIYDETEWPNVDGVGWVDRYAVVAHALETEWRPVAHFGNKVIFELGAPPPERDAVVTGDPLALESLQTGWYAAEEARGTAARWSAPQATALLRASRGDDTLAIDYSTFDVPTVQRTLTVSANDRVIGRVPLTPGEHHDLFPLGSQAAGDVHLMLDTGVPLPASDLRTLGVLVSELRVGPRAKLATARPGTAPAAGASGNGVVSQTRTPVLEAKDTYWDRGANRVHLTVAPVNDLRALEYVQIILNTNLTGVSACYISIAPASKSISLARDAGTDWPPPVEAGKAGPSFGNTQCTLDPGQVQGGLGDGKLEISVPAALAADFAKRDVHAWVKAQPAGGPPVDWLKLPVRAAGR